MPGFSSSKNISPVNWSQNKNQTNWLGPASNGTNIVSTSITTSGGPVQIMSTGDANPGQAGSYCVLQIFRGSTAISNKVQAESSATNENVPFALIWIDNPPAGTYIYHLKVINIAGSFRFGEEDGANIAVIELK